MCDPRFGMPTCGMERFTSDSFPECSSATLSGNELSAPSTEAANARAEAALLHGVRGSLASRSAFSREWIGLLRCTGHYCSTMLYLKPRRHNGHKRQAHRHAEYNSLSHQNLPVLTVVSRHSHLLWTERRESLLGGLAYAYARSKLAAPPAGTWSGTHPNSSRGVCSGT